jgi:hypothetical protein
LLALWRWRRPAHAFLLLWLPVALLPGMLSEGAPNFLRPIAALTVTYAFPALAASEGLAWLRRRTRTVKWGPAARAGALALPLIVLGLNAWRTYDGYFVRWPRHPDARFAYSSTLLDASRVLDGSPEIEHALLSGHFPADLDAEMVARFLRRTDLLPRWADVRQALVYPASATSERPLYLLEPDYFPVDPLLGEWFAGGPPLYEQYSEEGAFVLAVHRLDPTHLKARWATAQERPVGWSRASVFPDGQPGDWTALAKPTSFGGQVSLLGYEPVDQALTPGDVVTLLTYWQAEKPGPADGITFLHLLGADGTVVTGYDGFGAPPNRWQAGDTLVQVHRFALPGDLATGDYALELGWYERASGARWTVELTGGGQVDRVLLEPLHIKTKDE